MTASLKAQYEHRYSNILVPAAASLEALIRDHMRTAPEIERVDRITVRAKSVESFLDKAAKVDEIKTPRYSDPLVQIQDQIGARIIVFYKDDIEAAQERVKRYFTFAEQKIKEPESEWEFGYFGLHFILSLPADVIPRGIEKAAAPTHFELQIRTLFQHAWSEAEHDLIYKAKAIVTSDHKRQCAYAAAQAWGADRIFDELCTQLKPKTESRPDP